MWLINSFYELYQINEYQKESTNYWLTQKRFTEVSRDYHKYKERMKHGIDYWL